MTVWGGLVELAAPGDQANATRGAKLKMLEMFDWFS
jgi:hypothetical protein